MRKTYIKIIIQEIKSSFGRFTAIFSIVALSVGFLFGLLTTTPDMMTTVDQYYDDNKTADIFIKATMGLTEKDINTVASVDEVEQIMPAYVTDVLLDTKDNEIITSRILGLPLLNDNADVIFINNLELRSGRMPQNETECLVERSGGYISEIGIGEKLIISKENDDYENLGDIYKTKEYTVVGIVSNPFYFSVESERSSIGNGRLGAIVYVDESCYSMDVYTDFYIVASDTDKLTAFTEEYETYIEGIVEKLDAVGENQSVIRYEDIQNEAIEKINKAKIEYEDAKKDADTELASAAKKIEDGKSDLADAASDIDEGKIELANAKATLKKETEDAQTEINDGYIKLSDAKIELEDGEAKYADGQVKLQQGQKEYDDGLEKFLDSEQELKEAQVEFDKGEKDYLDGIEQLEDGKREIRRGQSKLSSARNQLVQAEAEYNDGMKQLAEQKGQFNVLMDKILGALSGSGLTYSTFDELFLAMEGDTSGTISGAVTAVLEGMKNGIAYQISALQTNNTDLENSISNLNIEILNLESLIENIKNGTAIPEDGKTVESLEADLAALHVNLPTLMEQQENNLINIDMLNANLNSLPQNAEALIYSWKAIKLGETSLQAAAEQISSGWDQYQSGLLKLKRGKAELREAEAELEDAKIEIEENRIKLEDGWAELEKGRIELKDAYIKLKDGYSEANDARIKLDDGWIEYYDGMDELSEAEVTLENEVAKAESKISDGEADLAQGTKDYKKGVSELTEGENEYLVAKADAEKELSDAAIKIADAEKQVAEIDTPKWYVLDRNSNVSYASFSINSEKVADITKVFPVFFFLIAALVTLTTMTRMVEEERTQIGTLKALGYRKGTIISKYIIYAGLASTLGSIAGLIIGYRLLPSVIWNAYRSMYRLPELTNQFLWRYALPEALLIIILILAVTVYVCSNSLKEKPSKLMLPRVPKAGKRIFLERINFIWSRMKFSYKSTARNIMRYKRHLYMTVIGIAGCTALILTGFGLLDSIGSIANTQFTEIFRYNLMVELDDAEQYDTVLKEYLGDKDQVESYAETFSETGYLYGNGEKITTTVSVPNDSNTFTNAILLRDRTSGNEVAFDDSSVIMTEKLSETLDIHIGEPFELENGDGEKADFVLTGITENYVGCYLYVNKNDYAKAFNKGVSYNTLMVKTSNGSVQQEAIKKLLASDSVMNIETVSQIKKSFDSLLTNIKFIVTVLILAAGALAVIVLYNLTNINISERRKELSTLKVLGYHNEEVAAYVFRETTILSIAGTCAGLFLGVTLHLFVVKTVEASNLMLGRSISFQSFAYSAVITMLFAMLVNLIMYRKLRKIEMVESMKAID